MKTLFTRILLVLAFASSLVLMACNQDGSREHPTGTDSNEHPASSGDHSNDGGDEHPAGEHPR